jgi:hypothetical protein
MLLKKIDEHCNSNLNQNNCQVQVIFKDLIGSFSTNMVSQSIINQVNPTSPLVVNPHVINLSIL